ncbi:uncharacterized protein LOC108915464 [Anoplophora glabripennis]|uniref:uncharacterized protein LOC108915464 n=1 Tax=Anoplophora glabripennis TaxID=217634 RepID=UPI00087400D7|nr:uncharacterized protein LOC108915464 [Anoplophora glabripennis]
MVCRTIVFDILLLVTVNVIESVKFAGLAKVFKSPASFHLPPVFDVPVIPRPTYDISFNFPSHSLYGRGNVRPVDSVGPFNSFANIRPWKYDPSPHESGDTEINFANEHWVPNYNFLLGNTPPPLSPGSYGQNHNSIDDTGSAALEFFLNHSLAKSTTSNFTIHHYYRDKDTVEKEATIDLNAITTCVGDIGTFCPANTTSLCTKNGTVMCVTSATTTVPCNNEGQTSCVRSSVPCKDNNSTECKQSSGDAVSMTIPCISTAKVYGSITFVNNSIVVSNSTASNTDTITNNSNTAAVMNATNVEGGPPQKFCVTILALPTERQLTEGEKLFSEAKEVFSLFAVNALGLN